MSVDSIADFLTIIRNGVMVSKSFVTAPCSKMRQSIAQILKDEGFIHDFVIINTDSDVKKILKIVLKYVDGEAVIHEIQRISKPGRRVYINSENIKPVIGQLGVSILTTNRGVIANQKAKKLSVGGEVICTVW
ncbi:MAG TPA: 30S ribosomal protein S8 [Candidatus Babeliales bacterium]|nr:30S ribosomal protein S8 [Candidatus Babeliales bacterium]